MKEELSQPTDGTSTHLPEPSPNGKSNTKPSKFDHRCSTVLQAAAIKNGKGNKTSKEIDWANQFRLLRQRDGKDKKLIKKILLWYIDQDWTETYMPQAFSAKTFREKFNEKLLPAYERANQNSQFSTTEPRFGKNKKITLFGIQTRYHKKYGCDQAWWQERLDTILAEIGDKPGSLKVEDV